MARDGSTTATGPSTDALLYSMLTEVQADAAKRLIVAAVAAFAARGYHATTTRDISVAAGMSPAAMYVHYPSKEELLFATSRVAHEAARQAISESAAKGAPPIERLRAIVRDFTLWHAQHASLARVAQYQLDALSPEHHETIAGIRRRTESIVRNEIRSGLKAGAFHVSDVPTAARAILSMGIDVARWFRVDGPVNATDLANRYADLAVRMVGATTGS